MPVIAKDRRSLQLGLSMLN